MADVSDIKPLNPIWPAVNRSANRQQKQEPRPKEKNGKEEPERHEPDDGRPHVDEYA